MNREECFFIHVLADHISGKKTVPYSDIDWDCVFSLSRKHQVDAIVYYQCKSFMPEKIRNIYDDATSTTVFQFLNREHIMQDIVYALQEEKVSYITVKGLSIAQLYPVPAFRTMGDCDIIVPTSEIECAQNIFQKNGFHCDKTYMQHEWTYEKNGFIFELQDVLVREDEYTTAIQNNFFINFMDYKKNGKLDWNYHFIYLLMHLRKHMIKNGAGIRQFMDFAIIINSEIHFDWKWIEETLRSLDLWQFSQACFDLVSNWFGIKAPLYIDALNDEFRNSVTEKILSNGVFGFADHKNDNNLEKNSIVMGHTPRWINRLRTLALSVFLPYGRMRRYPGFEYVDNRVYLMPIAWIHRFGMLLHRKDKTTSIRTIQKYFVSKDELDEREEFLSKMGLNNNKKRG